MPLSTIILNSRHRVPTGYEYVFPSNIRLENATVALQSISLYNSFFNVTAARGNNRVQIDWPGLGTFSWIIPNGYYSISDLNYWLQSQMVQNYLYMVDANSDYVYFFELRTQAIQYAANLSIYTIPTDAQRQALGLEMPVGATWTCPEATLTPQFTVMSKAFGDLLGLTPGMYPATPQNTNSSHLSTTSPQISPVNALVLGTNLVQSKLSIPSDAFFSLPIKSGFGSLMNESNPGMTYIPVVNGNYSKVTITLYDQAFNILEINDPECVIVLSIKT